MPVATDAVVDLEAIKHLDFDTPKRCEVFRAPKQPCVNAAAWAMQCRGCGEVTGLCCHECRGRCLASSTVFYHNACKVSGTIEALILWLPLDGI